MQRSLQLSFRGLEPSEAVERSIRAHADRLDHFGKILGCRVAVEAQHRRHRTGRIYHVRIDLTVPGREIVVNRDPAEHHAHEDIYVAIRDAFDAVRRQLEDFEREVRGDVKHHEPAHRTGRVRAIFADYGFVTSDDGREIYFHEHSVLGGGFDKLSVGSAVRFVEETGDQGPQASSLWSAT